MHFKILMLTLTSSLLFVSCASHQQPTKEPTKAAHHHNNCSMENCQMKHKCEMFKKKCAASVAHGDFHVEGKEDHMLMHDGHKYFFSSEEKKEQFEANLDSNLQRANDQWKRFQGSSR